jgi:hypothetical protein
MAMILSETQKSDFKPIEEGPYVAVCCHLIDIGDHYSEQYDKTQHKCLINFELFDAGTVKVDDREVNRTLSNRYTMSFSNKSTLRKDLRAWRGREFTDEELKRFDLKNILGAYCQLGIIHRSSSTGSTYANIASIMALPKSFPKPEQTNTALYWDFEESEIGDSVWNLLPEWIRTVIEGSETYKFITEGNPGHLSDVRRAEIMEYKSFKTYRAANSDLPYMTGDDEELPF